MKLDDLFDDAAKKIDDPKHHALVLFSSYPRLRQAVESQAVKYVALGGSYSHTTKVWSFESGARIEFGVVDSNDDVERLRGTALTWLRFTNIEEQTPEQYRRSNEVLCAHRMAIMNS